MAIEQVFIFASRDTFTAEYIGVDPAIHDGNHFAHHKGASDPNRLPAFETMLTEHGFTLADSMGSLRIWTRKGKQLALGVGE